MFLHSMSNWSGSHWENVLRKQKDFMWEKTVFVCEVFFRSQQNNTVWGKKKKRKETDNKMPVFELGGL